MKVRILLGVGVVAVLFFAVRWLLAEPTITVNFTEAPLSQVLAAFERQGKIKVQTTLDLNKPVTLQVRRSPVIEAIDLLAVRVDGDWRVAWVLGPDKASLDGGIEAVGRRAEGWQSFFFPTFGWELGGVVADPRKINWRVEAAGNGTLSEYLNQGSQKLPVEFFVPAEWNPAVTRVPKSGNAQEVVSQLVATTKGASREVFVLTGGSGWEGWGGGGGEGRPRRENEVGQGASPGGQGGGGGGRPNRSQALRNEAWLLERAQAMGQSLPPEQRAEAVAVMEELQQLREQTRELPEEQRREAWSEYMQRPAVQERMEESRAARDAKRTPEQREARYKRIAERRLEARAEAGNPMKPRP